MSCVMACSCISSAVERLRRYCFFLVCSISSACVIDIGGANATLTFALAPLDMCSGEIMTTCYWFGANLFEEWKKYGKYEK